MEIERKWLIEALCEREVKEICDRSAEMEQAYICVSPVIRIRKSGGSYELTVKGRGHICREEFNIAIDSKQYNNLLLKADDGIVRKTRYYVPLEGGLNAEVDVYRDSLAPLITAEVEFGTAEEAASFTAPSWFGREVSEDGGYSNASLARLGLPAPISI